MLGLRELTCADGERAPPHRDDIHMSNRHKSGTNGTSRNSDSNSPMRHVYLRKPSPRAVLTSVNLYFVHLQLAESSAPVGSPVLSVTRAHVHIRTLAAEHHERQRQRKRFDGGGRRALTFDAWSQFSLTGEANDGARRREALSGSAGEEYGNKAGGTDVRNR